VSGNRAGHADPDLGATTYLDRIVPAVRRRLRERQQAVPRRELEAQLDAQLHATPRPSFEAALGMPGISLIAEVKRRSPSKGPIRPHLDVADVVCAYECAGARAISVLTEQDHFSGKLDDLDRAALATTLPILRKDFILDEYQLVEAAAHGASAVLLIAALLPDKVLARLSKVSARLGLDVLLEVHDERELDRALQLDEALIGINNRDLRTFAVSAATTELLLGKVPPGRMVVSESGIWTRDDVASLAQLGVDGVLVGESLLRSPDIGRAVVELLSFPAGGELPLGKKRRNVNTERDT
jgi:indole-3-glycerol phosphate synthase